MAFQHKPENACWLSRGRLALRKSNRSRLNVSNGSATLSVESCHRSSPKPARLYSAVVLELSRQQRRSFVRAVQRLLLPGGGVFGNFVYRHHALCVGSTCHR